MRAPGAAAALPFAAEPQLWGRFSPPPQKKKGGQAAASEQKGTPPWGSPFPRTPRAKVGVRKSGDGVLAGWGVIPERAQVSPAGAAPQGQGVLRRGCPQGDTHPGAANGEDPPGGYPRGRR